MNRNTSSHFSLAPQVDIQRSTFNRDSTVKTSFNVGQLIPFYLEEVLPGDTFAVKTSKVARMQTLKTPMMDDIFLDTYYFFVPNRLVWNHWREFMGENTTSAWVPTTEYTIPQILTPETGFDVGTVADYLGVPPGVPSASINALPFRGFALIYNEYFRDENLQDPLVINTGDSTVTGSNGDTFVSDVAKGGVPPFACKTHDYFTSCLPAPQKSPDGYFGSIETKDGLPVYTVAYPNEHYLPDYKPADGLSAIGAAAWKKAIEDAYPLQYGLNYSLQKSTKYYPQVAAAWIDPNRTDAETTPDYHYANSQGRMPIDYGASGSEGTIAGLKNTDFLDAVYHTGARLGNVPVNLVASGDFRFSINELRQAFQIQRFYEKCARGGTRYIEIIKSHFGVTSPDARMQRPEYLGGNRLPLNVRQITQTSSTTDDSPLGDVAGMSVTTDNHYDFEKSFTEHGYIFGVCVARYHHTYQQGLDRTFSRKTKFDYYWPVFAHLGEQAVKLKELFFTGAQGSGDLDDLVFGYQEAWAEYRYKPNRVSGLMRSVSNSGLDSWHLGDYYTSRPYLSDSWIREDPTNVDRVLTVTSAVSDQIFADLLISNKTTRPMPLYSIPGLIDHF